MAQRTMLQQQGGGSTLWKEWRELYPSTAALPADDLRGLWNSYTCKSHFIDSKLSETRTDTEESEVLKWAVPRQDVAERTQRCWRPFPYHPSQTLNWGPSSHGHFSQTELACRKHEKQQAYIRSWKLSWGCPPQLTHTRVRAVNHPAKGILNGELIFFFPPNHIA